MANNVDDHSRAIIHIDIDCFYAQVEINKNPRLADVPFGVQQKHLVVTANYKARAYGIAKCMTIDEARLLCPTLVLVNGEDLHDYRQISQRITQLLTEQYTTQVERLGLDENFLDVTQLVEERLRGGEEVTVDGHLYGDNSTPCECGCTRWLMAASRIAHDVRQMIRERLQLTTCAGIAHNKLLAKLACGRHKPDSQTLVLPNSANELLMDVGLAKIPGIGRRILSLLESVDVHTIADLQNISLTVLQKALGVKTADSIQAMAYGIDNSPVRPSGRPQSIGIEDSCRTLSAEAEIREKLRQLLDRLVLLVEEDGRLPRTIRLTVRKAGRGGRESRQCHLTHFNDRTKTLATLMMLFGKIVDLNAPYRITLLGLACTRFLGDKPKLTVADFVRRNYEVQTVVDVENKDIAMLPGEVEKEVVDGVSVGPDVTESPRPKKLCVNGNLLIGCYEDCVSPSKLPVAELSLSSPSDVFCPPGNDEDVFAQLPKDIQKEIWDNYKREVKKERQSVCGLQQARKNKPNTLLNYFVRN